MRPERPVVVVLGDVATDVIVRMRAALAPASDAPAAIELRPGGSAANQAAWLAHLGAEAHLIARVGDDTFGTQRLEELHRRGVLTHVGADRASATGLVVVLVDPAGERTMLPDRGANRMLRPSHLPRDAFRAGACLHLSAYALLDPHSREASLAALELARRRGMTISVDPASSALLASAGPHRFLEWTAGAAICFPSIEEGQLLTGATSPEEVASQLSRRYGGVALKLGPQGALWARDGKVLARVPAARPEVVDTTGAGDAFCAGFLAAWLAGATPMDALTAGGRASATVIGQVGARPG